MSPLDYLWKYGLIVLFLSAWLVIPWLQLRRKWSDNRIPEHEKSF